MRKHKKNPLKGTFKDNRDLNYVFLQAFETFVWDSFLKYIKETKDLKM